MSLIFDSLAQGRQLGMAGVCSCHTLGSGGEIKVTFKYKYMNVSLKWSLSELNMKPWTARRNGSSKGGETAR